MNSGEIWSLMPPDFQSKVKTVRKLTNNVGGIDKNAAVTATSDRLFLLSYSEIAPCTSHWTSDFTSLWASDYPWSSSEGSQYEAFKGKVTNNDNPNSAIAISSLWWERSVLPKLSAYFLDVTGTGRPSRGDDASASLCVCPAWCF